MSGKSRRSVCASVVRTDQVILQWFRSKQRVQRKRTSTWFDSPPKKLHKRNKCEAFAINGVRCKKLCATDFNYCCMHQPVISRDKRTRCLAQTDKEIQCKNLCTQSRCHVHREKVSRPCVRRGSRDKRERCIANTMKGVQCKIMCTTNYCHVHRAQVVRHLGWRTVCEIAGVYPVIYSVEELHEVLLKVGSLESQATTSIRLIAEFGVGGHADDLYYARHVPVPVR